MCNKAQACSSFPESIVSLKLKVKLLSWYLTGHIDDLDKAITTAAAAASTPEASGDATSTSAPHTDAPKAYCCKIESYGMW